ncbi:MAG: trypsin-like serine protease [Phycisphaeraceae bacterium]
MTHARPVPRTALLLTAGTIALSAWSARAVTLNDDYFVASGGDLNDIPGTLDAGYSQARAYSFEDQFLAVGWIGNCTATWLGNSPGGSTSYILTAAHCGDYSAGEVNPANRTFTDWDGRVIASGNGTFYVPPQRINPPPGYGGASTDIAILALPRVRDILDPQGNPVPQPVLYDGGNELGNVVSFVGYGSWGVGSTSSNGGWFPSTGPRRAGVTNVINGIWEQDHGIGTNFDTPASGNATATEGAVASGDSGSAWWQEHDDTWTIIATTNGGSGAGYGGSSTGARVSQYVDWIQGIYPQAVTLSQAIEQASYNLVYRPGTGKLLIDTKDGVVINYVLQGTGFVEHLHERLFDSFGASLDTELAETDGSTAGVGGLRSIGQVLEPGLSQAAFEATLTRATYVPSLGGGTREFNLVYDHRYALWYDATTGEVLIDTLGEDLINYVIQGAGFIEENHAAVLNGTQASTDGVLSESSLTAEAGLLSLGAVLPARLTPDQVIAYLTEATYVAALGTPQTQFDLGYLHLPGDTDLDVDIDDSDLGTAFSNYTGPLTPGTGNKSAADGDTDGDGDVDDSDLGTAFAGYTGPLAPVNAPEPGTLGLLGLGVLAAARRGRRTV